MSILNNIIMFKSTFTKFFTVVAASVLLASCAEEEKVSLPLAPEDAVFAAKVDVKSIYEKSLGDGSAASENIMQNLQAALMQAGAPTPVENILKKALNNPMTAFGLNLNQPVLVSATMDVASENVGVYFSLPLSDKALFCMILDQVYAKASKSSEYDSEYDYYGRENLSPSKETLSGGTDFYFFGGAADNYACCAVAGNAAVVYVSNQSLGKNGQAGKAAIEKLLSQSGSCTGAGFDAFMASQDDLAIWYDVDSLLDMAMPMIKQEDMSLYAVLEMLKPYFEGVSVRGSLDFEKGKTVVGFSVDGPQQMKDMVAKYTAVPSDKFFSTLPASSVVAANIAISKKALSDTWTELLNDPSIGAYLKQGAAQFGIGEEFISGLPGTITAGLTVGADGNPVGALAIECDKYVYDTVMNLLEAHSGMVESTGLDTYMIYEEEYDYDSYNYYYGYSPTPVKTRIASVVYVNGAAIITTDSMLGVQTGYRSAASRLISNGGFVLDVVNLPSDLMNELTKELSSELHMWINPSMVLDWVSSVSLTAKDGLNTELSVNMGDQQHNILQKLIAVISQEL